MSGPGLVLAQVQGREAPGRVRGETPIKRCTASAAARCRNDVFEHVHRP